MAATAEISKPDTAVRFTAYREDLRLTKVQRYPIIGPGGRQVGEHPGEAVQFRSGMLVVADDGVRLEDGRTLARDEALEWLRGHRLYGDPFEGFLEVTPAAPPVSQEELSALMDAVLDEDALTAIIEAEEKGWGRDDLLVPARTHLGRLREMIAAHEAETQESKPAAKRPAKG